MCNETYNIPLIVDGSFTRSLLTIQERMWLGLTTLRRQNFLRRRPPDLREALAHLVGHSRRRIASTISREIRRNALEGDAYPPDGSLQFIIDAMIGLHTDLHTKFHTAL